MTENPCPVGCCAEIISGKWTLLLIRDLAEGSQRFCELERSLDGISPRTLSLRLGARKQPPRQGAVWTSAGGGARKSVYSTYSRMNRLSASGRRRSVAAWAGEAAVPALQRWLQSQEAFVPGRSVRACATWFFERR